MIDCWYREQQVWERKPGPWKPGRLLSITAHSTAYATAYVAQEDGRIGVYGFDNIRIGSKPKDEEQGGSTA